MEPDNSIEDPNIVQQQSAAAIGRDNLAEDQTTQQHQPEDTVASEDSPDGLTSAQEAPVGPTSAENAQEGPTLAEEARESPTSADDAREGPTSAEDAREGPISAECVSLEDQNDCDQEESTDMNTTQTQPEPGEDSSAGDVQSPPTVPCKDAQSPPTVPCEDAQSPPTDPCKDAQSPVTAPPEDVQSPVTAPPGDVQSPVNAPPEDVQSPLTAPPEDVQSPVTAPPEDVQSPVTAPPEDAQSPVTAPPEDVQSPVTAPPEDVQSPVTAPPEEETNCGTSKDSHDFDAATASVSTNVKHSSAAEPINEETNETLNQNSDESSPHPPSSSPDPMVTSGPDTHTSELETLNQNSAGSNPNPPSPSSDSAGSSPHHLSPSPDSIETSGPATQISELESLLADDRVPLSLPDVGDTHDQSAPTVLPTTGEHGKVSDSPKLATGEGSEQRPHEQLESSYEALQGSSEQPRSSEIEASSEGQETELSHSSMQRHTSTGLEFTESARLVPYPQRTSSVEASGSSQDLPSTLFPPLVATYPPGQDLSSSLFPPAVATSNEIDEHERAVDRGTLPNLSQNGTDQTGSHAEDQPGEQHSKSNENRTNDHHSKTPDYCSNAIVIVPENMDNDDCLIVGDKSRSTRTELRSSPRTGEGSRARTEFHSSSSTSSPRIADDAAYSAAVALSKLSTSKAAPVPTPRVVEIVPISPEPSKFPEEPKKASPRESFYWTCIDRVTVPYIIRVDDASKQDIKYVSVKMVENQLLSKYPRIEEMANTSPIFSYYVTANEAKILSEINARWLNYRFGREKFSTQDLIVRLDDFLEFYERAKTYYVQKSESCDPDTTSPSGGPPGGGWVQINNTVVPYVVRGGNRMVPLSVIKYAAGLEINGQINTHRMPCLEAEYLYLNDACQASEINFTFSRKTKLVKLELVSSMNKVVKIQELPKDKPLQNGRYVDIAPKKPAAPKLPTRNDIHATPSPQSLPARNDIRTIPSPQSLPTRNDIRAIPSPQSLPTRNDIQVIPSPQPLPYASSPQMFSPPPLPGNHLAGSHVPGNGVPFLSPGMLAFPPRFPSEVPISNGLFSPPLSMPGMFPTPILPPDQPPPPPHSLGLVSASPASLPLRRVAIRCIPFEGFQVPCVIREHGEPMAMLEILKKLFVGHHVDMERCMPFFRDKIRLTLFSLMRDEEVAFIKYYDIPTKNITYPQLVTLKEFKSHMEEIKLLKKFMEKYNVDPSKAAPSKHAQSSMNGSRVAHGAAAHGVYSSRAGGFRRSEGGVKRRAPHSEGSHSKKHNKLSKLEDTVEKLKKKQGKD